MPSSSPPRRSLLSIVPPEIDAIDAAWSDETPTCPGEITERVTKVPSVPSDLLAKQLMRDAQSDSPEAEHAGDHDAEGYHAGDYTEESDVFHRGDLEEATKPEHKPSAGPVWKSPDDVVTYRPPVTSSLTPGSPFFGSAPAPPHIVDSEQAALGPHSFLDTGLEIATAPEHFTIHEAPTVQKRSGEADSNLEFDLTADPEAALRRAEETALVPARSKLDLARRFSSIPARPTDPLQDMRDRHAIGDFTGALDVAERVLASDPDQREAFLCAQNCRDVLTDMFTSRIGGTQQRAVLVMSPDQIRWLSLDHRAGFLLAMVDGVSTVDELLDICGMPRLEALRILCNLVEQQAVALET